MSQNITLLGASYSDVPSILLPKTGGGMAQFDDTTTGDAVAEDIASGKKAWVNGTLLTGTSSGGSSWTHVKTAELSVSTTSTSAASAGTIACGSSICTEDKIIYVRIRDKAGKRAGHFVGSDAYFMNYNKANGSTSAFNVPAVLCHRYTTASQHAGTAGQYGVYGYSISNSGTLTIRRRYNSSYSLTIDGTYVVDVFILDYPSGYPSVFDITAST